MLKQNWNQHMSDVFYSFLFKKIWSSYSIIDNTFILQEGEFAKHQILDKN